MQAPVAGFNVIEKSPFLLAIIESQTLAIAGLAPQEYMVPLKIIWKLINVELE